MPQRKGSRHVNSRLNEDQVAEILSLRGKIPQQEMAARFGISKTQVSRIVNRTAWRHVCPSTTPQS